MTGTGPEHRLSATILLIRDAPNTGPNGLEVLMIRRAHEIDFASGAFVFPGGKIDPGDHDPAWEPLTNTPAPPAASPAQSRPLRVGALRELYEETGLLLTTSAPPNPVNSNRTTSADGFIAFAKRHSLELDTGALIPFGHWITPDFMPKRFDTHFFIAPAPAGQTAQVDGHEATEAQWITPQAALDAEAAGKVTILFPTRLNLQRLCLGTSVAQALERFAAIPIVTVKPELETGEDGQEWLTIPEFDGYRQTREPLQRAAGAAFGKRPPAAKHP